VSLPRPEDLATLVEMVEAGQVRPVIDHSVPLEDIAEAIAYVAAGHNRGTTVITMPGVDKTAGAEGLSA
jgi:NADPH:quinone reductase-like Zn-dependent oxidoreductase